MWAWDRQSLRWLLRNECPGNLWGWKGGTNSKSRRAVSKANMWMESKWRWEASFRTLMPYPCGSDKMKQRRTCNSDRQTQGTTSNFWSSLKIPYWGRNALVYVGGWLCSSLWTCRVVMRLKVWLAVNNMTGSWCRSRERQNLKHRRTLNRI